MYRLPNRVQCISHPASRVNSTFSGYKVGIEEGRWLGRVYLSVHTRGKLGEHRDVDLRRRPRVVPL